eukprot:gnl/MRDRNA2_/MRDRNA2_84784_c0_seq1.p1 gnl/MRDRNA2_/MRDRNA2_84784_c0~~gnl/MRDRNA2_/MRDRNA2_84784_c0_seq1.p1  ORF type:complete len:305 (+),score=65.53 gnl/MRDRNA2_/MRDRNA2_84784_c0_seq1:56-970(+)
MQMIKVYLLASSIAALVVSLKVQNDEPFDDDSSKKNFAYAAMWVVDPNGYGYEKSFHSKTSLMVDNRHSDQEVAGETEQDRDGNLPHELGVKYVLKTAIELQKVGSKYPFVVITNDPILMSIPHNESLRERYPNVVIRESEWMKPACKIYGWSGKPVERLRLHHQKIQIFGMSEYDKVLYMDTDVSVKKNLDSIFDKYDPKEGLYGQQDDYFSCQGSGSFASGIMLFKPSAKHVEGLINQQKRQRTCGGDQDLIKNYFNKKIKVFPKSVIDWSHCNHEAKNSMAAHCQRADFRHDEEVAKTEFW